MNHQAIGLLILDVGGQQSRPAYSGTMREPARRWLLPSD
jgi:hypothetical protein